MIVIKSTADKKGQEEFEISNDKKVYEINIETGEAVIANLIPIRDKNLRSNVFMIDEKTDGKHVYIPALNRKNAQKLFNAIAS